MKRNHPVGRLLAAPALASLVLCGPATPSRAADVPAPPPAPATTTAPSAATPSATPASNAAPSSGAVMPDDGPHSQSLWGAASFSKDEVKMGKEAVKEIDKQVKLVTDPALIKRVTDIGLALVKVSPYKDTPDWTFKVIDEKEVNAFALPGGFVYVYKGLLDKVESDDELAGVLAHELTHAMHHHALKIDKQQRPWDFASMAVMLAGILSGKDVGAAAYGIQLVDTAKINSYTIGLEEDADAGGMALMMKSRFNPVGMLTFMERLARDEAHSGSSSVQLGIFRDHPYTPDRAAAMRATLEKANVPINRRLVTKSLRVTAEAEKVNNQDAAVVKMDNQPVLTLAGEGGVSAMDRAKAVASQMNDLLDKDLRSREVYAAPDGSGVVARFSTVIKVSDADARLAGETRTALAQDAAKHIQNVLWGEYLRWNS